MAEQDSSAAIRELFAKQAEIGKFAAQRVAQDFFRQPVSHRNGAFIGL